MRRQVLAQGARQTQPKGPHELDDLPPAPDRLSPPETGDPPGMAALIDPPRVLSEEPTAVTPHGGIRGGESQQWLSYPTNPRVGFDERDVENGAMVEPLRHRQTKGAETDMLSLTSP